MALDRSKVADQLKALPPEDRKTVYELLTEIDPDSSRDSLAENVAARILAALDKKPKPKKEKGTVLGFLDSLTE